jgi:hypothetical protein
VASQRLDLAVLGVSDTDPLLDGLTLLLDNPSTPEIIYKQSSWKSPLSFSSFFCHLGRFNMRSEVLT